MPKANAEVARDLARLSSDCSFLLTHLIRQNDGRTDVEAKTIMMSILSVGVVPPSPLLRASSVGWYSSGAAGANIYNPTSQGFDGVVNSSAVCFTESTLAGLRAHRDIFSVKYGVAFDRDWLFAKGGNPCLNLRESLLKDVIRRPGETYLRHVYNFIPSQLHPFVNVIHESFDATHEREWRHPADLGFSYSDLLFIFCPEAEFPAFSAVQSHGKPVLFDLAWLDRV